MVPRRFIYTRHGAGTRRAAALPTTHPPLPSSTPVPLQRTSPRAVALVLWLTEREPAPVRTREEPPRMRSA